ncbi:MAG TPA: hypothetical protein VFD58_17410 [Blastocatellia bacterium]|nr:hypothetical protein [Blastocatellia bacterium]
MTEQPTKEAFAENLRTSFRLHAGGPEPLEIELVSLTTLPSAPRQEQFSLIFRGPANSPLQQNIYRLDHDRIGSLEIFLVPIARDKDGVQFEAIFNRIHQ